MLGSDPIRQYDNGLGTDRQGVVTLEPVYKFGGGDSAWVHWFFKEFVDGESMAFAYTQAGQENSFTWDAMAKGFGIQLPLIAQLRDEHKVKVETLAESGKWFRAHYAVTPATSVTVTRDIAGSDRKTVWFDSRFYRANLEWEHGTLRFRDIHLFDEHFADPYTTQTATSNACAFFTLPFVDGYIWSAGQTIAGLRFKAVIDGKETLLEGGNPTITSPAPGKLHITWPLKEAGAALTMDFDERQVRMKILGAKNLDWFLDLSVADNSTLPFTSVTPRRVDCLFDSTRYAVSAATGSFSKPGSGQVLRISPVGNVLTLAFTD
jgi:hypothetical protein